jgi:hypothetical protein
LFPLLLLVNLFLLADFLLADFKKDARCIEPVICLSKALVLCWPFFSQQKYYRSRNPYKPVQACASLWFSAFGSQPFKQVKKKPEGLGRFGVFKIQ